MTSPFNRQDEMWGRLVSLPANLERKATMQGSRNPRSGVTLIEMLVVVVIIAVFAGVAVVKLLPQAEKGRVTGAREQVANLQHALQLYKLENGTFPTQEQGFPVLRQYLEKDLGKDPWGHPYIYKYPGDHGDEPDVICYGADGQPGGEGNNADIVSWK